MVAPVLLLNSTGGLVGTILLIDLQSHSNADRKSTRLKLQYFVHLMRRADSLEKTLMLGGIGGRRRRGRHVCVSVGFPVGSDGKESACNAGDLGLILELGRPFPVGTRPVGH